jgi:hypothetical protein
VRLSISFSASGGAPGPQADNKPSFTEAFIAQKGGCDYAYQEMDPRFALWSLTSPLSKDVDEWTAADVEAASKAFAACRSKTMGNRDRAEEEVVVREVEHRIRAKICEGQAAKRLRVEQENAAALAARQAEEQRAQARGNEMERVEKERAEAETKKIAAEQERPFRQLYATSVQLRAYHEEKVGNISTFDYSVARGKI